MPVIKKVAGASRKVTASSPERKTASPRQSGLELPTKKNEPPKSLSEYAMLIYGEKSIGKTSLIAELSDLIFMCERGRKNLSILQIPDHRKKEAPLTWERMVSYQEMLIKQGKIGAVGIDTLDRSYELCFKYVCAIYGIKTPSEYGKEAPTVWIEIKRTYEDFLVEYIENGISPRLTSHARVNEINKLGVTLKTKLDKAAIDRGEATLDETANTVSIKRLGPTMSESPLNVAKSVTDLMVYYGYYNGQRALHIRGNDFIDAGCNIEDRFLDPKGNPISVLAAGNSAKSAAKALLDSFNNKVYGIEVDES